MDFAGYLQFLTKLGQQFQQLVAIEQEKLQAVTQGNLALLDDCMRKEQAASLALRGLEHQRSQWVSALGLPEGPLSDLPKVCPAPYRGQATQVVGTVLDQFRVLEGARKASRALLEGQLHKIEKTLAPDSEPGQTPQAPQRTWTDFRA